MVDRIGGGSRDFLRDARRVKVSKEVQIVDPAPSPAQGVLLLLCSALHSTTAVRRTRRGGGVEARQRKEITLTSDAHIKIWANVDTRVNGVQFPKRKIVPDERGEPHEVDRKEQERPRAPTP